MRCIIIATKDGKSYAFNESCLSAICAVDMENEMAKPIPPSEFIETFFKER